MEVVRAEWLKSNQLCAAFMCKLPASPLAIRLSKLGAYEGAQLRSEVFNVFDFKGFFVNFKSGLGTIYKIVN